MQARPRTNWVILACRDAGARCDSGGILEYQRRGQYSTRTGGWAFLALAARAQQGGIFLTVLLVLIVFTMAVKPQF